MDQQSPPVPRSPGHPNSSAPGALRSGKEQTHSLDNMMEELGLEAASTMVFSLGHRLRLVASAS